MKTKEKEEKNTHSYLNLNCERLKLLNLAQKVKEQMDRSHKKKVLVERVELSSLAKLNQIQHYTDNEPGDRTLQVPQLS